MGSDDLVASGGSEPEGAAPDEVGPAWESHEVEVVGVAAAEEGEEFVFGGEGGGVGSDQLAAVVALQDGSGASPAADEGGGCGDQVAAHPEGLPRPRVTGDRFAPY
uniref:hypothetical protein n=1 Tax=Herbidospora sakaeratensis TaxID=564415 RepID=UPI0007819737|nr:hypothetical protein [Herbidospora sakaeratensis]